MARNLEEIEAQWRKALEDEDETNIESIVREVLREHPHTTLASEIHYKRGTIILMSGEGYGGERLARAIAEFNAGVTAGNKIGEAAEPWRSLNRTQSGVCSGKLGNIEEATRELKAVAEYRPRSGAGLGALSILSDLLRTEKPRDAKRYDGQRLSYARALVRENKESPDLPYLRFLLASELLTSEYKNEGKKIMLELHSLGEQGLGEELFAEVQEQIQLFELG